MRALVELCGDVIELFLAPAVQGSAFGQILAEQAVAVLIGPTSISVEGPRSGVRRGDERRRPRSAPNGRRGVRRASSSGSCVPPKWRSLIAARSQRSGPLPMPPLAARLHILRPVVDRPHAGGLLQRAVLGPAAPTSSTIRPPGAQILRRRHDDHAAIDSFIDRLVTHMPLRPGWVTPPQPPADLCRRPLLRELGRDKLTQNIIVNKHTHLLSSAIAMRSSWLRYPLLIGVCSTMFTLPASMNHNDPQLNATPTCTAASDPEHPCPINSK